MYTYKIGISAQEHDDFVKQSSQTNLLQSASWAKVKDNWDNERIGFYKNNQLVASASILIKPLPLSMTMLYIPRGPIMDYQDQELLHFVLTSLKKFSKTKKALFIKFDPSLFLVQNQSGEERQDNPKTLDLINNLQKAGAIWLGRTELLDETIQPRFQANIYKDNFSEELLSKSTRQAIRTARNKGIQVQFGGSELLDDFSALMKKTDGMGPAHAPNIDETGLARAEGSDESNKTSKPILKVDLFSNPQSFSNMIGNCGINKDRLGAEYPHFDIKYRTDNTLARDIYIAELK